MDLCISNNDTSMLYNILHMQETNTETAQLFSGESYIYDVRIYAYNSAKKPVIK